MSAGRTGAGGSGVPAWLEAARAGRACTNDIQAATGYQQAVSGQFLAGKFGVNEEGRFANGPYGDDSTRTAAAVSDSARNAPICRRSSSWMTSTLRRASSTRKPNSSAMDAYSRSSERWYARKLS